MAKKEITEIVIEPLLVGHIRVPIIGISPIIMNAMSAKARHELLLPKGRKTAAEKKQSLKHDVMQEYRDSVYVRREKETGPTRIIFPAAAWKKAIMQAALEVPGSSKAQIGRLAWVEGDMVDLYGVPEIHMGMVRNSDMNKTPDVRTRAIIREWACIIDVKFMVPTLSEVAITRLLETAGLINGMGDFRQQKGGASYGQFRTATDEEIAPIIKAGGMKAQDKALEKPECYDMETERLLEWYLEERKARGK